jgi:hypothetical protein
MCINIKIKKIYFIVLAEDAIKAALSDYRIKQQSKINDSKSNK